MIPEGLVVDLFAGGGGASTGIERALGRAPDIAINHSPVAIAMHAANHPTTRHYIESVYEVDPVDVTGGRPVALLWLSPDCTHHSKAKGGKPRQQKIRGLAWAAIPWAQRVRPRVIALENVEEWVDWGPIDRTTGQPIKERRGETFRAWRRKLERLGYAVEHRLLRAADYGAPTTRRRLFLQARCDGRPIVWPEPTHARGVTCGQLELGRRAVRPWRTAAEIIDWSIPCPSIFDRARPLADKTMARIARGIRKYVLEAARPFVIDAPLPTVASGHALVAPYLVHRSNGERKGQAPRIYTVGAPLGTIVAQGQKHAVCAAFLARHYGDREGGWAGGLPVTGPTGAITTRDHHALVSARLRRRSNGADGKHAELVAAFLSRYNGASTGQLPDAPIGTLDTHDRYALVTVTIDGEVYAIVDIGMRMLTPRELFRAQGFPDGYVIDPHGVDGKPLTKTAQIRACGNAVPPHLAEAVVRAALLGGPP